MNTLQAQYESDGKEGVSSIFFRTGYRIVNTGCNFGVATMVSELPSAADVAAQLVEVYNNDVIALQQVNMVGKIQESRLTETADRFVTTYREASSQVVVTRKIGWSKTKGWYWK